MTTDQNETSTDEGITQADVEWYLANIEPQGEEPFEEGREEDDSDHDDKMEAAQARYERWLGWD